MQYQHGIRFEDGVAAIAVWAPKCRKVELETRKNTSPLQMQREANGWFSLNTGDLRHGDAYRFRLDEGSSRPDPSAHAFESSVHEWNIAVDHSRFEWRTGGWKGVPKPDLIIYELHLGTFTQEGTFLSAIERIDELIDLGITAIEILPVAQCPGRWNWGYDGVGIYAVQNTYGSPDDFKTFIDACHEKGIAVILDVVLNHLGPEGNYLSEYGHYFTKKRKTPWGDALNFDGMHREYVRSFMSQCAIHWIENYRLDGLRLDAVHFMFDDSEFPISMEVTKAVDDFADTVDRHIHLIGETNVRNASLTKGTSPHETGFDAVWSDGMMHSVLGIGQPGLDLCHRDHSDVDDLSIALQQGFIYENFPYERHDLGQRADLSSFVIGFQNHDTVGNHPLGHRIHQLASREFQMASAPLYLLYPAIPMIFMGEEFASEDPFLFFVDFKDSWVREGVEQGRAKEFPELNAKLDGLSPLSPKSFHKSKMGHWEEGDTEMRSWYQKLIQLRKKWMNNGWLKQENLKIESNASKGIFILRYKSDSDARLTVAVRLTNPKLTDMEPVPLDATGEIYLDSRGVGCNTDFDDHKVELHANRALIFVKDK